MAAAMLSAADLVIPKFHDVLGDVMAHGHTHYWLHGGRGSTKSFFISLCLVLLVIAFPYANAVVVRRFGNTLRDSVYQQVLWAISSLDLESYFKAKLSPMEITYLPTGQRIVFRGADDPLKLKGIKFTKGLPGNLLVRRARLVRRHRGGALHPQLAQARRRFILDLLQL